MIAGDKVVNIMSDVKNTNEKITEHIETLKNRRKDHIDLLGKILETDNRALYGVDLVVIAVTQRSISLIDGFTKMVEDRNYLCANALLRLQLDNIIRLYACWLVEDPHSIALVLLEGKPLNKVKSRENKTLSDSYLVSEASKLYPWLKLVYEKTSGFVHLSQPHMLAYLTEITEDGILEIQVGKGLGREWKEEEVFESVSAFGEATACVLHLCYSWMITKDVASKKRMGSPVSYPSDAVFLR